MKAATLCKFVGLIALAPLMGADGCEGGFDNVASDDANLVLQSPKKWSDWSEPVLVTELNTAANDANPCFAPDDLTIYFTSGRSGGMGGNDLWFSRRASPEAAWGAPEHLGSPVNSDADEQSPSISKDGLLLFFVSTRTGGFGGLDVYVARRTDPTDDAGWGTPENLGSDVNTSDIEQAPHFQQKGEGGLPTLYFQRGTPADLFIAPMTNDGQALGSAAALSELNSTAIDAGSMILKDGLEFIFNSNRAGGTGAFDLYVSTRSSVDDAWSAPVNFGAPVNTTSGEFGSGLSFDGRTLLITRDASGGGAGGFEIWVSTRTVIGNSDGD